MGEENKNFMAEESRRERTSKIKIKVQQLFMLTIFFMSVCLSSFRSSILQMNLCHFLCLRTEHENELIYVKMLFFHIFMWVYAKMKIFFLFW